MFFFTLHEMCHYNSLKVKQMTCKNMFFNPLRRFNTPQFSYYLAVSAKECSTYTRAIKKKTLLLQCIVPYLFLKMFCNVNSFSHWKNIVKLRYLRQSLGLFQLQENDTTILSPARGGRCAARHRT